MATRDIITDLTDLAHPLPEEPGEFADDSEAAGWSAMREGVAEEREAYEQSLRLTWDHDGDFDPLLGEIAAARDAMLAAEARMRLLIAYGREFTRLVRTGWRTWPAPPACRSPGCAPPTTTTRSPRSPG